jgi:hypothetical protein
MRGLKIAVAILAVWCVAFAIFTLTIRHDSQQTRESLDGLMELLEIHRWEVPMPKDARYEWSFEIRDYKAFNVVEKGTIDWIT